MEIRPRYWRASSASARRFPFDSLFESNSAFEAAKASAHMHMHKPQLKPSDRESDIRGMRKEIRSACMYTSPVILKILRVSNLQGYGERARALTKTDDTRTRNRNEVVRAIL